MSDENKAVVRAFLLEVIGSHDADARPDLLAPGYVSHFGSMPPLDHEGWKQMADGFFTAFPDLEGGGVGVGALAVTVDDAQAGLGQELGPM